MHERRRVAHLAILAEDPRRLRPERRRRAAGRSLRIASAALKSDRSTLYAPGPGAACSSMLLTSERRSPTADEPRGERLPSPSAPFHRVGRGLLTPKAALDCLGEAAA